MKIFCIGYPRTGTHSLITALRKLGFSGWHYNTSNYYHMAVNILKTKRVVNYHLFFNDYEAFADTPIFYVYKQLDAQFPNSKFILITRPKDKWYESMRWMLEYTEKAHPEKNEHNRMMWSNLYPDMIEEHTQEVKDYFTNRPGIFYDAQNLPAKDLFVEDIEKLNYESLSHFLGKNHFPAWKFPHEHKRNNYKNPQPV